MVDDTVKGYEISASYLRPQWRKRHRIIRRKTAFGSEIGATIL